MKQDNTIAIMQLMHREGGMTKNQIASVLKLSNTTVHNIVTELKEKGFCRESSVAVSNGGRNAVIHEINEEGGLIVGQKMLRNKVVTNVFDYGLNKLYEDKVALDDFNDVNKVIRLMIERILHCMEQEKDKMFIGVGISICGRVDKEGRIINILGYPQWRNVHLKEIIMTEINLPIFVENDNNAATLAWKWCADTVRCDNAVFYDIGEGVGMGVLINGKVFGGSNNNGCEIGHVPIILNGGSKCSCGNYGCLESLVKDDAIVGYINQLPEYRDNPICTMEDAIRECKQSKAVADIFSECLHYVMIGVEYILKLFDPELIVIRCPWMKAMPQYFMELQKLIYQKFSIVDIGKLKILMDKSKVAEMATACVFLERFYSGEVENIYM